jgi:hypothetical protein
MDGIDPNHSWLAILLSGLFSALFAAFFTHWIENRKERRAASERMLSHLRLIEIELRINSEKNQQNSTDYLVEATEGFLRHGDIGNLNNTFLTLLVRSIHVMKLFNLANQPFSNLPGETTRVNKLHKVCVETANSQLGIDATCKNDVPGKLKASIDEGLQLLEEEIRRVDPGKRVLKTLWIKIKDWFVPTCKK